MFGSKSFTLVELVVTIGIILLLAVFVLPNLGDFRGRRSLERVSVELRNKALEAQALALAPRRADQNLTGYGFVLDLTSRNYGVAKLPLQTARVEIGPVATDSNVISKELLGNEIGIPTSWPVNSAGVLQLDFLIGSRAKAEVVSSTGVISSGTVSLTLTRGSDSKVLDISLDSGTIKIR